MYTNATRPPIRSTQELAVETGVPSTVPENYYSQLPLPFGAIFGVVGSLLIMGIIGALSVASGEGLWLSPRIIASALLGDSAASGALPVILGTMIHLASGAMYGLLFARLMPRMPRPFWMVAGLVYGISIWLIAYIALPIVVEPIDIDDVTYFNVLLLSHLLYGFYLGVAGGLFGLMNRNAFRSY